MLLPVFSIAQPPTSTIVFAQPFVRGGFVEAVDESSLTLIPTSAEVSTANADETYVPIAVQPDEAVLIPYTVLAVSDMITHGTSMPPMRTVIECEDAEQEFGEAEMFLVNRWLWEASPKPSLKISHVTRDSAGTIFGGATVKLFRTVGDLLMETEISDPTTGAFTLSVFDDAEYYYHAVLEDSASSPVILASSGTVLASAFSQLNDLSRNDWTGS